MNARLPARLLQSGLKFAVILLLVAGLFALGILLTPPAPTVQAVNSLPVDSQPRSLTAPTPIGGDSLGTLASFTALIPEISVINLPLITN
jgi:hypothetical protein